MDVLAALLILIAGVCLILWGVWLVWGLPALLIAGGILTVSAAVDLRRGS